MTTADRIDYDLAHSYPAKVFKRPADVLTAPIGRAQKLAILRRWEMDARLLSVAADEGMTGGEGPRLNEVGKALVELGETEPATKDNPSKLGG
jgi:hypothetical protein